MSELEDGEDCGDMDMGIRIIILSVWIPYKHLRQSTLHAWKAQ